jgi:L-cysteine S-thiosulfotransferase
VRRFLGQPSAQAAVILAALSAAVTPGQTNEREVTVREVPVIVDGAIATSLTGVPGDASRGRKIVADRQAGLCLLCHTAPIPEQRFQGDLAPDLAGAGSRWSTRELRARVVDARIGNPSTIMPAYYVTQGLARVAPAFRGKTLLDAQEIEDVVTYLETLK